LAHRSQFFGQAAALEVEIAAQEKAWAMRKKEIEAAFARWRSGAAAGAPPTGTTLGTLPAHPNLPSQAKRRMSSQDWRKQMMAETADMDRMREESEEKYGQEMAKNIKLAEQAASDRARAVARMYDTIRIYDERSYKAKQSLLAQELDEFRRLKISETDIARYELEKQRQLLLEHAKESADIAKGLKAEMDELKKNRLKLGQVGVNMADSIHGEWVGALQGMATEGASWSDSMKGFFRCVGDSFSNMMARMAAEALLFEAISPIASSIFGSFVHSQGERYTGTASPGFSNPPGIIEAKEAHGGGIMGVTAFPTRPVPASAFAGAPRLHGGSREIPAILRDDEHVLTPPQMNKLIGSAGGSGGVDVHIHNEGFEKMEITKVTNRFDGDQRIIDVSIKAMSNNMQYRRAHGK